MNRDAIFKVFIYKRTHTGDPNKLGVFGCNDCMKSKRSLDFDAVIGIGGIGREPRKNEINGKLTWVGSGAKKVPGKFQHPQVTFERFTLWDKDGVALDSIAPELAKYMYERNRRLVLSRKLLTLLNKPVSWKMKIEHEIWKILQKAEKVYTSDSRGDDQSQRNNRRSCGGNREIPARCKR